MNAKRWQDLTMFLVLASFVMANFSIPGALVLWTTTPQGLGILISLGVGMKMTKDVIELWLNKK